MPDVSIMISAQDNYSSAIKSMSQVTKSFSKDATQMEETLRKLNANKTTLKLDADAALKGLKDAQKQFEATGKEADGLKVQLAQANYDNVKRNLDLVTKGAREAERQMRQTGEAFRKAENRGGGGGFKTVVGALATSGIGNMASQLAQQTANTLVSSAFGSDAGTIFSNALSSGISGAAIGSMILPGVGTAIGAAAGAAIGGITGVVQNFQKQDDAFKNYVQENTETQIAQRDSDIQAGSSIASGRQTDLISFTTMFKDKRVAEGYLGDLVDMANTTPFLYDDLTAMSKTLATYGYGAQDILPVLGKIGDTGAALGMNTSDMNMVATALGRMKSSNKTSLEYLNILNDRGIGAVGMLADEYGVDQGKMYDMISKGKVEGGKAVEIILSALTESYAGSMKDQSETFAGKSSTLEGMNQEIQNAYGEGYNDTRKGGIQEQIDWLSGASGEAQQEANKAIGAWQASLENAKEQYIRDAVDGAMETDEYQKAKAEGNAAEMGRIIMQAKVKGQSDYNANEGKDEVLASELALADGIRDDTRSNEAFWNAGYLKGENYTRGIMAGIDEVDISGITGFDSGDWRKYAGPNYKEPTKHAWGLNRVPYDNFPALLHEGERVLTASQARAQNGGSGEVIQIDVHDNSFSGTMEQQAEQIMQIVAPKLVAAKTVQAPR